MGRFRAQFLNVLGESIVIPFTEHLNAQIRWEVFNLANHPVFGQPSGNASSGSVASITSLSADPRVMQFALRLNF